MAESTAANITGDQTGTAWAELEAARRRARETSQRPLEVRSEQRRAEGAVVIAREKLRDHYAAIERGEAAPNATAEAELRAELDRAREQAGPSERWEAKAAAALGAVQAAEQAVPRLADMRYAELAAEAAADALAARDRLLAAVDELRAASAVWAGVRNRYVWLGELTNRSLAADLPSHPLAETMSTLDRALAPLFSGELRDPRRLVPAPSDFLPDERETASERTITNG